MDEKVRLVWGGGLEEGGGWTRSQVQEEGASRGEAEDERTNQLEGGEGGRRIWLLFIFVCLTKMF